MQSAILLVVALVMAPGAAGLQTAKNRPVSKVVTLLKDMSNQLEKEAESDEDTYDKMACWCSTNDKEKTKSIANAEQRITDLSSAIEEGEAAAARLNAEIGGANTEIAKNTNALDQATSLRSSQLADFNDEEKEMLTSIGALKSAVTVLGKHHEAMLQAEKTGAAELAQSAEDSMSLLNIGLMLKTQLHKHLDILGEVITPQQKRLIASFTEEDTPMNAGSYAPASGAVFGIIKNMKESFEANLAASQKEEHENQKAYEELKAAKNSQIAAGNTQVQDKTTQLGNTQEKVANDKQDLEDTQNTLAADQDFLANLKMKCEEFDAVFEQRSKTRKEEIAAVSKAMAILSGDDAHDLFTKTFNPAFLQKVATQQSARREKAASVLTKIAQQTHNPKLAAMAMRVRLNAFPAIKKSLQDMIDRLDQEKEDEVKLKDFCIDEMNRNERESEETDRDKERTVAKIEDLTSTIDTLTSAITELKAEVTELQLQMAKAGEEREEQNREFQTTVADQRATQKLLTQALNVLKGFYDKKAALLRTSAAVGQEPAGPPPPPDFASYENSNASGGVMGMLQQIINDAVAMEAQAIKGEEESQAAYESFVTDTNNSINALSEDITNKTENRAQAEADKTEASTNLDATMRQLEYLANESADLHSQCDFTLKNFDVRQAARDDEVEALKQSIAILSGASAGFLQK